ncbi:MAG: hypothetical protein ACOX8X_03185 [Methanomethylophilus sp.]|jgi:hypothetical protein
MGNFAVSGRFIRFDPKDKDAVIDLISLLTVVLFALVFQLLVFNKLAPQSEGWYTLYADMILDGKTPYVDFDLLFPPLYAYIMTALTWAFGNDLIVYRVFGIFVFLALALVFYYTLKLVFPNWVSAAATVLALAVFQSNNSFLAYDYVNIWDIFAFLSFYYLLRTTLEVHDGKEVNIARRMFVIGFLAMCGTMVRQSSGVMLIAFIILFIALAYWSRIVRFTKKEMLCFFLGLAVSFLIITLPLIIWGAFSSFIDMTLFSGSKGSLGNMLYGWIERTVVDYVSKRDILTAVVIALFLCIAIYLGTQEKGRYPENKKQDIAQAALFAAIVIAAVVCLYSSYDASSSLSDYFRIFTLKVFFITFAMMIVMFAVLAYYWKHTEDMHREEIAILMMLGLIFTLNWGSGTSGGLSLNEGCFGYAILAAVVLWAASKMKYANMRRLLKISGFAFVILLILTSICVKVVSPYSWWGIESEPYEDANSESDLDYFTGIELTENEKYVYEDAVDVINSNIGDGSLYVYSRAMLFYTLTDQMPVVKAPVAWFDVSQNSTIGEDLAYLQTNHPKVIVFADHGDNALSEHEKSFDIGENHRLLYNWLIYCRDDPDSGYEVAASYMLQSIPIYILVAS